MSAWEGLCRGRPCLSVIHVTPEAAFYKAGTGASSPMTPAAPATGAGKTLFAWAAPLRTAREFTAKQLFFQRNLDYDGIFTSLLHEIRVSRRMLYP